MTKSYLIYISWDFISFKVTIENLNGKVKTWQWTERPTMDMRLQSQTKTTRILPGRLWPLLTLSAHSCISQANDAGIDWGSQGREIVISYFPEVGFLFVVVSLMCEIFSRWLQLNIRPIRNKMKQKSFRYHAMKSKYVKQIF